MSLLSVGFGKSVLTLLFEIHKQEPRFSGMGLIRTFAKNTFEQEMVYARFEVGFHFTALKIRAFTRHKILI